MVFAREDSDRGRGRLALVCAGGGSRGKPESRLGLEAGKLEAGGRETLSDNGR